MLAWLMNLGFAATNFAEEIPKTTRAPQIRRLRIIRRH